MNDPIPLEYLSGDNPRLQSVHLSASYITSMLTNGCVGFEVVENPLPKDAVLTSVSFDGSNIRLVFHSQEFGEVIPGALVSSRLITVRRGVEPLEDNGK